MTPERKEKLEKDLLDSLVSALEKEIITEQDMQTISQYILSKIDLITADEELNLFLSDISSKWPLFSNLSTIASGQQQEKIEDQVVQNVTDLTHEGKIDEAVDLAKTITE